MKDRNDIADEYKCEYLISSNRKKLWIAELDLLENLETICKQNGLNYFVLFGSAVGCIRHKGFIPWDDDIDIGMLREDFEKFLACDKTVFPDYVEIQYGISKNRYDPLLRIRDGRTTGITNHEINKPGNKGAFIEIYIFDYVKNNQIRKAQIFFADKLSRCMNLSTEPNSNLCLIKKIVKYLVKLIGSKYLWKIYTKICTFQNKNKEKCNYVDTISLPGYAKTGQHLFYKKDVSQSIYKPFEYTRVRLPKGYDRCLAQSYGDYMQMPPICERGIHHSNVVFYDPNHSYLFYERSNIPERYLKGDNTLELL